MAPFADLIKAKEILPWSQPITWEQDSFLHSAVASASLLKKIVLSLAKPPVVNRTREVNTPHSNSLTLSPYSCFFTPSCILYRAARSLLQWVGTFG